MKTKNTSSCHWNILADNTESPSLKPVKTAPPNLEKSSNAAAKAAPKTPAWRNLTLDELRSWFEEAKRRQAERKKASHPANATTAVHP